MGQQFAWNGHFRNLEAVAFGPISSPKIMNMPGKDLIGRLAAVPGYVKAFHAAYGDDAITRQKIEFALATFQRSIVSNEAPFDIWIKGDEHAISDQAKRGFDLFNGKANCAACHSSWAFTDGSFHDIGVAARLISAVESYSRTRSNCATASRRRRCVTSRAAHPTCTMVRLRLWTLSSTSMIVAASTGQAAPLLVLSVICCAAKSLVAIRTKAGAGAE